MNKKDKLDRKLKRYNTDGFTNALSGMGIAGIDKQVSNQFQVQHTIDQRTLENMYRFDWLTKKICNKPASDALRKFIDINDESSQDILKLFTQFSVKQKIQKALSWSRLFGGAAVVLVLDDGLTPDQPLDISKIKSIVDVLVFDRHNIVPTGLEQDINSPQYQKPEFYQVRQTKWHHSRVFIITGDELTFSDEQNEQGWGGSFIDLCVGPIDQLQSSYNDMRHLLTESSVGVTKIPGLSLIGTGGELFNAISSRLNVMNTNKSIYRSIAIDAEESFDWINRTFSGVENILDRFVGQICACTDMPELVLFGKSKGGLSSGQQEEMDVYHDLVESIQEIKLTPVVQVFVDIFSHLMNVESPSWEWTPLTQLTEVDQADIRLKNAQSLALESDAMDFTEDEAREISKRSNQSGLFDELDDALLIDNTQG